VNSVAAVLARVSIDASALNVDRDVDLVAVDANANEVPNVVVEPPRARVRVPVARVLVTRTLPIVPQLVGELAPGYVLTSVTVEPVIATISGEEATVTQLQNAPTSAIDISGRTTDLEAEVSLALPAGVTVSGSDLVRVALTVAQETGSQSYRVGVVLDGARPDLIYTQATPQVNLTLSGPLAVLQAIDATQLAARADVAALGPGIHTVALTLEPPPGVQVLSLDPTEVSILIEAPPTPTPPPPTAPPTQAPPSPAPSVAP
jgi:YbbR domain-containing protein